MSSDQSGWRGSGDEPAPFTHQPYGSGDAAPEDPTLVGPPSPSGAQAPPPSPYGAPAEPSSSAPNPYGQQPGASPYAAGAPVPYGYGGQGGYAGPGGYPGPGGYGTGYYQQSHGRATTSMVLGIVSLGIIVVGFCLYGLPSLIALVTGPIGLWLGLSAKRDIDAAPGTYANRGHAVAGWIMGLVATILAVLIVIALIALFAWIGWAINSSSTY